MTPANDHGEGLRADRQEGGVGALADKIVTAIEGRFRDWLMSGEHAEAKQLVAEVLARELDGWTVRAEDYAHLAGAARALRAACRHKLAPGHYAQLEAECRALDRLLSPNDKDEPRGGL